ncbi:MAG: Clp protease N-terminal domain-containing protein [Pseudonocardiaceae bacterium]
MFDKLSRRWEFFREMQALLKQAEVEARLAGSRMVEAEHLLTAMAAVPFGPASRALGRLGLSRDRIAGAIERERCGALALAGVQTAGMPAMRPFTGGRSLRWNQSARLAADRSCHEAPDDPRLRMLLGIVHAEAGVMPRLLTELDVSREDIEQAVRTAS